MFEIGFHTTKCINHHLKEAECADPASLIEWDINYNISNSAFNEPDLDGHTFQIIILVCKTINNMSEEDELHMHKNLLNEKKWKCEVIRLRHQRLHKPSSKMTRNVQEVCTGEWTSALICSKSFTTNSASLFCSSDSRMQETSLTKVLS